MNASEISKAMDALEAEARAVLADPDLGPIERRQVFQKLLRKYGVLKEYMDALAAFIRRMRFRQGRSADPSDVIHSLRARPEFIGIRLMVFAMFVAVMYSGGPRSAWVPVALLPVLAPAVPSLR